MAEFIAACRGRSQPPITVTFAGHSLPGENSLPNASRKREIGCKIVITCRAGLLHSLEAETHMKLQELTFFSNPRRLSVYFVVLLFVAMLCGSPQLAYCVQNKSGDKTPPKPDAKKQIEEIRKFQEKLATIFDPANPDTGDYIPCKFTITELMQLRPKPEVVLLSAFDAEELKSKVIAEALSQANAGAFDAGQEAAFVKALTAHEASLTGKTPSEALATIISLLSQATALDPDVKKIQDAALKGPQPLKEALRPFWPSAELNNITIKGDTADERILSAHSEISKIDDPAKADVQDKLAAAMLPPTGPQAVVAAARAATSAFRRPDDIACAMSILDWNTVRYGFGQTVADQYIGVQVVVRNLNADLEFLVHDAQFAVDTDINGSHGSFFSGIDKLTVRGYSLASRPYGRRNFMVNLAQGAGTIMSAVAPIYGHVMRDASSVYNSGFLTALPNVWKDSSTEQLNLLNDVGFSASKTERTVVPKSGTAMFVIFVESKPFQQAWWTQNCAQALVLSKTAAQQSGAAQQPAAAQQSGVDLEAARTICLAEAEDTSSATTPGGTTIDYVKKPKSRPYKNWSNRAQDIFRELAFTVVAGTHVIETKDTNPSLTSVECPKDKKGDLDFSKIANGTFTCKIAGTNLDKISSLRLRNAEDQTDTKTADGKVGTDTVSFPAAQICSLYKPVYNVFIEGKDGTEIDSKTKAQHVDPTPSLTADPDPAEVPLDKLSAQGASAVTVKLQGCHLQPVTAVEMKADKASMEGTKLTKQTDTELSFDVTPDMVTKAKIPPGDYTATPLKFDIALAVKDSKTPVATEKKLQGTGKLTATPKPTASAPQLVITGLPKSVASGTKVPFTVTAKDATGKTDTGFAGVVKFTNTDGKASALPDSTLEKGEKSFSVTFNTPGKQNITATSGTMKSKPATTTVK
jgi:hypothetical protein